MSNPLYICLFTWRERESARFSVLAFSVRVQVRCSNENPEPRTPNSEANREPEHERRTENGEGRTFRSSLSAPGERVRAPLFSRSRFVFRLGVLTRTPNPELRSEP